MLLMEIEQLVEKGKIKGRIDLIDQVCPHLHARMMKADHQVLHIRASDARQDAYKSALDVGQTITASTRAAIIRLKM